MLYCGGEKTMPRGRSKEDHAMLEMALIGYEHERERLVGKIEELQSRLKGEPAASRGAATPATTTHGGKRVLIAVAHRRIDTPWRVPWAQSMTRWVGWS